MSRFCTAVAALKNPLIVYHQTNDSRILVFEENFGVFALTFLARAEESEKRICNKRDPGEKGNVSLS